MKPSDLKWSVNLSARSTSRVLPDSCKTAFQAVESVHAFHRTLPGYRPTPLVALDSLAGLLDVHHLAVKDESQRLGLAAFKVMGVSYAVARHLAALLGLERIPSLQELRAIVRARTPDLTLAAATEGNHGHGLAWTARQLGLQAIVFVPAGCARSRYERIASQGAQVVRTDLPYERTIELAAARAREHGWALIQDTAWDGYSEIPSWIMHGYLTVVHEATAQWQAVYDAMPTHVLVQAGVGSFAAAVQCYLSARWGQERPRLIVIEPSAAPCLLRAIRHQHEQPHLPDASQRTIMAGLDCRRPNPLALEILRSQTDLFVSCSDDVAARGMRILASPTGLDPRIISGESGGVGIGVLSFLCAGSPWSGLARAIGLGWDSRILAFNTEGDTDPEAWRRIVWDGAHGSGPSDPETEPPAAAHGSRRVPGRRLMPS